MSSGIEKRKRQGGIEVACQNIAEILNDARATAYRAVNAAMVKAYWEIGRVIVEEEQRGVKRADYGKTLIEELAKRLTERHGKGFAETNLKYMRLFYRAYPIRHALRDELTWTHYRLLLRVKDEQARNYYITQTIDAGWSTRDLDRQISSLLYERSVLSRGKSEAGLTSDNREKARPRDVIRDPYVLEFLDLAESSSHQESDIEQGLIDRLRDFLLELGKGFALVARQKRITVGDDHFYVDLVFYHHILRCFLLIDLKVGKLTHQDIGQMDFYARWYEKEEKAAGDGPTIGLILCSQKNDAMARYTLLDDSENIFASRYQLYLPSEEELRRQLSDGRVKMEMDRTIPE